MAFVVGKLAAAAAAVTIAVQLTALCCYAGATYFVVAADCDGGLAASCS